MCFRPAETELPPATCPSCGTRINRVAGQLPKKCPFCKSPTEGAEDDAPAPASPAVVPAPTAHGMPNAPSAPKAPGAPISK